MSTVTKIDLNNKFYSVITSSSKGSVPRAFSEYTNTGSGIYKTLGVGEVAFEALVYGAAIFKIGPERINDFTNLSKYIASTRSLLIVTKLTGHTIKQFFESAGKWFKDRLNSPAIGQLTYSIVDLTKDVLTFVRMFRIPEAAKFLLKKIGACLSFVKAAWDIQKAYSKYSLCQSLQNKINSLSGSDKTNFETYLKEQKTQLMLKVAYCVVDIAISVLLISGFVVGFTVAPTIAFWGLGAISLGFDFASGIYEQSMTYKLIETAK